MKRTTLIAIAVGTIMAAALPGAYAQTQNAGIVSSDVQQQPPQEPQVNPPAVGQAGVHRCEKRRGLSAPIATAVDRR